MSEVLNRLQQIRLLRYGLASVAALAIDMGSFLLLLALAIPAVAASALGYSIGIVTHWLISSRAVFTGRVADRGPQRTRQKALFVGSALIGLGITTLIVGAAELAGLDPRVAKLVAIVVSFAATWVLRSRVVFRVAA